MLRCIWREVKCIDYLGFTSPLSLKITTSWWLSTWAGRLIQTSTASTTASPAYNWFIFLWLLVPLSISTSFDTHPSAKMRPHRSAFVSVCVFAFLHHSGPSFYLLSHNYLGIIFLSLHERSTKIFSSYYGCIRSTAFRQYWMLKIWKKVRHLQTTVSTHYVLHAIDVL